MADSFAVPWTVARQAPLSMEFSRLEYWSGLPFLFAGDVPNPGIKAMSSALAGRFLTTEIPGKPHFSFYFILFVIKVKIFLLVKVFLET